MKGLSLPINAIVIIAIGIIVLLALTMFFTSQFSNASSSMSKTEEIQRACATWRMTNCDDNYWNNKNIFNSKNMSAICTSAGYPNDKALCKDICGCS